MLMTLRGDRLKFWKLNKYNPFTCAMCENRATYAKVSDNALVGITPVCNVHKRLLIEASVIANLNRRDNNGK